ncbi:hypothetical protein DLH72_00985 [Candidatus Gracilibacteria bacterium]|nr:MAG: hypothetical protein DLH72_00985 [Candidatus Gracilibacteria bacterium]
MFNGKNKNAFTLVEIVISVFIIIILTSVAFFSYSGYSSKAKDTVKVQDITNIAEVIDFELLNGGELSKPDSIVSENATIKDISGYDFGDTVWYEGKFGKENISKFPSLSFGSLKDEYKYYLSKNLDYYVIEAELANGEKVIKTNYTIKNTLANNTTNSTTPGIGSQGQGTPETGNQGGGTPETGNQGGGTPETGNQGGGTPETGNQGGGTPETGNQGGGTPETGNQGGGTPETGNQGGGTPETGNQGGGTPETGNQGGGTPETGNSSPANNLPNITGFLRDFSQDLPFCASKSFFSQFLHFDTNLR